MTERVGGIKTVIEYARKFGITSPMPAYLPVALGAADITLWEQTAAFAIFPNDGVRVVPRIHPQSRRITTGACWRRTIRK